MRLPSQFSRVSPLMPLVLGCLLMSWAVAATWAQAQTMAMSNERPEGWVVNFGQPSSTVPDTYSAHLRLGQDLMQRGDLEGAAREFLECMRLFQPYVAARERYGDYKDRHIMEIYYQPLATASVNLGHALRRMGRLDQAIELYTGAADIAPGYVAAHESLGRALVEKGVMRHERLDRMYRGIGEVPPDETELNLYRSAVTHLHVARQLEPENAGVRIALSVALRRWGVLDSAIAQARQATQMDPRNPDAHHHLGMALMASGMGEGAVDAFRESARLASARPTTEQAQIQTHLGVALASVGDFDGAVSAHRRAVSLDPHNPVYQNNLGSMLRTTGKPSEALGSHIEAVLYDPGTTEFHLNAAAASREAGDLEGALVAYRRALRLNPKDAEIHHQYGLTLYQRSDPVNALEAYAAVQHTDISDAAVEAALADIALHFLSGRRVSMVDAMDPRCYEAIPRLLLRPTPWPTIKERLARQWMVLDEQPLYGDTRLQLQDMIVDFESIFPALFGDTGRWDRILRVVADGGVAAMPSELPDEIVRKAPERSPLAASVHVLAPEVKHAVLGAATVLRQADDFAEAKAELRWAARLDPRNPHILNNLGRIHLDARDTRRALDLFNRALRIAPDIAEVHFNAGVALAEMSKMGEATTAWQRALDLGVEDPRLLTYLGIAHLQNTELDHAYAMFRRAALMRDDHAPAHYYLGLLEALRQSASPITRALLHDARSRMPIGRAHYDVRAEFITTEALRSALEALRRADGLDSERREMYYYVGVELAIQDPALADVQGADVIHSVARGRGFMRDWAAVTNNIAVMEYLDGNLHRAETLLRLAVHDEPYYALPHWNLGRILMAANKEAEGKHHLATAIRLAERQGLEYYFNVKRTPPTAAPMPREACEEYRVKTLLEAFNIPAPVL